MKLKFILFNCLAIIKLLYLPTNNATYPIENYFDLAEVTEDSDDNSEKITKKQIENIKKKYFNKINKYIEITPIDVFENVFKKNKTPWDITKWNYFIAETRDEIRIALLKQNANNKNINNNRILDAFIINVFIISYSNILKNATAKNKEEEIEDFLQNIYTNISEKQKKIINDALDKAHMQKFGARIFIEYPK